MKRLIITSSSRLTSPTGRRGGSKPTSVAAPLALGLKRSAVVALAAGVICLCCCLLLPIVFLESMDNEVFSWARNSEHFRRPSTSVHHLMGLAHLVSHQEVMLEPHGVVQPPTPQGASNHSRSKNTRRTKDGRTIRDIRLDELIPDQGFSSKPVARGVAGLPISQTPAMEGARRAHIQCEDGLNVDSLAYWNDPPGHYDQYNFTSPFAVTTTSRRDRPAVGVGGGDARYITFVPDRGGWNNIRMSLEIIFIVAAATRRILVLPPKEPFYLLGGTQYQAFADFFPVHSPQFAQYVKVITFKEFILKEGNSRIPIQASMNDTIWKVIDQCDHGADLVTSCGHVFRFLRQISQPAEIDSDRTCLIFDQHMYDTDQLPAPEIQTKVRETCGPKRNITYWTKSLDDPLVLHFPLNENKYRLLTHFYAILHFTDPVLDNHFKRFVRDQLHYHDTIYCAAGKIVKALQLEGIERGFKVDDEGAGAYSALHVRRGDLQFKEVRIPGLAWYENTKEIWLPKEILYVATDERNKTFFNDLLAHHDLRYLDDYWDLAGLGSLDPSYMGMIDTIVASRARAFAGTWFSTFSGYINRLRGYHGMSMMDSWYSHLPKKVAMHQWKIVTENAYAYEWQDAWIGIDGNNWPSQEKF